MRLVILCLLILLAGCAIQPRTLSADDLGDCWPGCEELTNVALPMCLTDRKALRYLSRTLQPLVDIVRDRNMSKGDCGCLMATMNADGYFSNLRIIETNSPEVMQFLISSLAQFVPEEPVPPEASCVIELPSPIWYSN